MAKYYTCQECISNLDHGEICDCKAKIEMPALNADKSRKKVKMDSCNCTTDYTTKKEKCQEEKSINLQFLKLVNFSGIKELDFKPEGHNAEITGDNDTGKTTIANAYYWLIFGTNAASTPNFSPKPNDTDGKPVHKLTTSVEGVFSLPCGLLNSEPNGLLNSEPNRLLNSEPNSLLNSKPNGSISLKRETEEKWVTKHGASEPVLSGNEYKFYLDNTPVPKKEFDNRIAELIGGEKEMKCAAFPGFFARLDMKERRQVLFSLADFGAQSDYDLARNYGLARDYSSLEAFIEAAVKPDGVNHYTVDEVRAKHKPLLKKAQEKLGQIPQRIDEAKRAIPEGTPKDIQGLEILLEQIGKQKAELEKQLNSSDDEAVLAARRAVEEHKTAISKAQTVYNIKYSEEKSAHVKQVSELNQESFKLGSQIIIANSKIKLLTADIEELTAQKNKLLADYEANRISQYSGKTEWTGDAVCPLCNRELPADEIEQKKIDFAEDVKSKIGAFNLARSKKAEDINERGKNITAQIELKNKDIFEYKEAVARSEKAKEEIDLSIAKLNNTTFKPFEQTDEYEALYEALYSLQASLENADGLAADTHAPIITQIHKYKEEIGRIMQDIAAYKSAEKQRTRVDELLAEEKEIVKEIGKNKKILYQCDEFVKIKVNMITEAINEKFPTVRFKLFHEQLNEGIREICDIMALTSNGYQSYLSHYANEASRINADLEICGVLGRHFDISLPIFLDGGESVTTPVPPPGRQFICLRVMKGVKPLKINILNAADEAGPV